MLPVEGLRQIAVSDDLLFSVPDRVSRSRELVGFLPVAVHMRKLEIFNAGRMPAL
jgi:hypothetical protein